MQLEWGYKKIVSGYYHPDIEELELLWSEGMFVFDTNVLLDLYSYPETVRDVFLSVLYKVADRIWIPYQVGVEFHRNRFGRIKQCNRCLPLPESSSLVHQKSNQSSQSPDWLDCRLLIYK